jgi:formylglycine-generating enzyme required for sulfatase activity
VYIKRFFLISILLVSTAACTSVQPTPSATPTALVTITAAPSPIAAISHNEDWKPVVQNFNGIDMTLVPPGCFTMGNDKGRRDERPASQICFENAYWVDKTEVTNAQYGSEGHFSGANRPRENLLWSEARDFCIKSGDRLPTEAEWEYAARGPDNLLYPWGNELVPDNLVFDRNSPGQTADVGSKISGASWVGALDMSGNVFEWVSSLYKDYPYDANDGRENLDDSTSPRVYRGGIMSYLDNAASATIRFHLDPTERGWFLGFRCARDA